MAETQTGNGHDIELERAGIRGAEGWQGAFPKGKTAQGDLPRGVCQCCALFCRERGEEGGKGFRGYFRIGVGGGRGHLEQEETE